MEQEVESMTAAEIVSAVLARQWITWLEIGLFFAGSVAVIWGMYRAAYPKKRRYRERF
jgi:membrane protein implicated in regulation of membrane protease activity